MKRFLLFVLLLPLLLIASCDNTVPNQCLPPEPCSFPGTPAPALPKPFDLPADTILPSDPVGYLEASSAATPSGEYTYSIPLLVPPGRGLTPELSLHYGSRAGIGLLGVGWSVAGLSEIRRCGKTIATEAEVDGVDFDDSDRFCLNGEKMRVVAGNYGADASEYRTERDSFARILAEGADDKAGPHSFVVWHKDGRISRYEAILATRNKDENVQLSWLLRETRDRAGNTIKYRYQTHQSGAPTYEFEVWPWTIEYSTKKGDIEQPRRFIAFDVEDRPDPSFAYVAGVRIGSTKRLRSIGMVAPAPVASQMVGEYRFAYETSSSTKRSLLTKVTRCDAMGVCFWSKEFDYEQAKRPAFDTIDLPVEFPPDHFSQPAEAHLQIGDFDSDGRDDILYRNDDELFVRLSKTAPLEKQIEVSAALPSGQYMNVAQSRLVDADGDGATELYAGVLTANPGPGHQLYRWNDAANSFVAVGSYLPALYWSPPAALGAVHLGDFDGDGRLEALEQGQDQGNLIWFLRSIQGGLFSTSASSTGIEAPCGAAARVADLDADGRADLLAARPACLSSRAIGRDDTGSIVADDGTDLGYAGKKSILLDLNGDGLRDALRPEEFPTIRWNTGIGFGPEEVLPSGPDTDAGLPADADLGTRVGDINGDGREDIVAFRDVQHSLFIYLSTGAGFASPIVVPAGPGDVHPNDGWITSQLGDFNGDALLDVVEVKDGHFRVLQQKPGAVDVLQAVWDEGAAHPRERVIYSQEWSDAPEAVSCTFPQRCIRHGIQVVREHWRSQGEEIEAYRRSLFSYEDPRVDVQGRGFLGFGKVRVWDPDRHAETTTTYDHATRVGTLYPNAGLPAETVTITPILPPSIGVPMPLPSKAPARITRIKQTFQLNLTNGQKTFFVSPKSFTTEEWEASIGLSEDHVVFNFANAPAPFRKRHGSTVFDTFGSLTHQQEETDGGGIRRVTDIQIEDRVSDWILGLPHRIEVKSSASTIPDITPRVVENEFDARGQLKTVRVQPEGTDDEKSTTYLTRNADGLVERVDAYASGEPVRRSYLRYDDVERMFPVQVWNDLQHSEWFAFHPGYGVLGAVMDVNGVQTSYKYDGFLRPRFVEPEIGMQAEFRYAPWVQAPGLWQGIEFLTLTADGGEEHVWSDELGRTLESSKRGFGGDWIKTRQRYDLLGRLELVSRPNIGAFSSYGTIYKYDSLGRVVTINHPDNTSTKFEHGIFETHVWDPKDNERTIERDLDDRVVKSAEVVGGMPLGTTLFYGPFDVIEEVHDPQGNITTLGYDGLGRRTSLVDPDAGASQFFYNGFHELRQSRDALQQVTDYEHDVVGRKTKQVDNDGETTWTWDSAAHGLGQLASAKSADGATTTTTFYDAQGRPETTEWLVDGKPFAIKTLYDTLGRVARVYYPEVPGRARFAVKRKYDVAGWLEELLDVSGATPKSIWAVHERNADGALVRAQLGNGIEVEKAYDPKMGWLTEIQTLNGNAPYAMGYHRDANGNVDERTDAVLGRSEVFDHDELDRLTKWTLKISGTTREMKYELSPTGNLEKTRLNGQLIDDNVYGGNGKPHALTQSAAMGSIVYDARGRIKDAGGRIFDWTTFDLPKSVTKAGQTTSFLYDAAGSRVKKIGPLGTTESIAGLYERREAVGGLAVQHVFYVHGENGPVEQVIRDEATGIEKTLFIQADALGSVGVVSDEQMGEVERFYFEPFGQRIAADGSPLAAIVTSELDLGFAGHRHDDDLGLVDMQGRVYDPVLRRFLSPDPIIGDPLFSQAYDRYAYVRNNPLNLVDPSGYDPQDAIRPAPISASQSLWGAVPTAANCGQRQEAGPGGLTVLNKSFDLNTKQIERSQAPRATAAAADSEGSRSATGPTAAPSQVFEDPGTDEAGPDGDAGENDAADREQLIGGFAAGFLLGYVPFGGVGANVAIQSGAIEKGTKHANIGRALGEMTSGFLLMTGGFSGQLLGGMLSVTGIGGALGVPAMVVATTLVVGGVGNMAAGLQGLGQALSLGGGGSAKVRPEARLFRGGKHGIKWTEGPARAKNESKPQGQWGSIEELEYAAEKASTLKPGEHAIFDLPEGARSIVHLVDGTTIPASRFWIRNNGTGTFHGFPIE